MSRFERKGLTIVGCKMMRLDEVLLREHYAHLTHEPFFKNLSSFMQSSPVLLLALQGDNAVKIVRKMSGTSAEDLGTIRGDYANCITKNIIHSSDSKESAESELLRFFSPKEIFSL